MCCLAAGLYVLPLYLRGIQDYSATQTSLFFCVDAFAFYIGIVCSALGATKVNLRLIVLAGFVMAVCANLLFVYDLAPDTPAFVLSAILLLHGFSLGVAAPGITTLLLGRTSFRFIDFGMTIYVFFRQLGAAVGIAATVALIDIRETLHSSRLLDTANRLSPSVDNAVRHLTLLLHSRDLPPNAAVAGCLALLALTGILMVVTLGWRDYVAHRVLSAPPGMPPA